LGRRAVRNSKTSAPSIRTMPPRSRLPASGSSSWG
jgi:hypothetical protein